MPRRPDPLPEALGGAFSCADGAAAGISLKRLRAADLETPFRGVRRRRGAEDAAPAGPLAGDQAARQRVLEDARAKLVEALGLIREGAMSPLETDFRLAAVAAGLPEPLLDQDIRDAATAGSRVKGCRARRRRA
ncbi:hypothetical protein [Microbacterium arborescens]|uniref:hypothetical protein n=1 Tax=Microbacterium arborescens TaxID=33883 RepID=UPI002781A697|nr:hypothetical protein [Microbacterium arborescens]MDQ1217272.1 hypothetical protein [Microbacterium arborescens]